MTTPSLAPNIRERFILGHGRIHRSTRAGPWSSESSVEAASEYRADRCGWDEAVMQGSRIEYGPSTRALRIVDLFSGCGGLASGVIDAARALGLAPSVELAADTDRSASNVYQVNLSPRRMMTTNVWEAVDSPVSSRGKDAHLLGQPMILATEMQPLVGNVDLVIGGPPCQGHSTANNWTRQDDPRNVLYLAMPAAAIALQAQALIVENVMNIRNDRSRVVQTARANSGARRLRSHRGYRRLPQARPAANAQAPCAHCHERSATPSRCGN